jgi:hypothetical protein
MSDKTLSKTITYLEVTILKNFFCIMAKKVFVATTVSKDSKQFWISQLGTQ